MTPCPIPSLFRDVLETKIIPPRANRRTMARARLGCETQRSAGLPADHPASAGGYGKTTALVGLAEAVAPASSTTAARVAWVLHHRRRHRPRTLPRPPHRLDSTRAAPFIRSCHLGARPSIAPGAERDWRQVIDRLINAITQSIGDTPLVLIEEDYHLISRARVVTDLQERLINYMPPNMHVVVSVRHPLDDPALVGVACPWRCAGHRPRRPHLPASTTSKPFLPMCWAHP